MRDKMVVNIKIIGWKRSDNVADILIKAISGFFVQKRSICPYSYIKIDELPILEMGIPKDYDYLMVLDACQAELDDYKAIKEGGVVVVNTPEKKLGVAINSAVKKAKAKLVLVDATGVNIEHIGKPDPTVAMLAAFVKKTDLLSLKNLENIIKLIHRSDGSLAVAEEVHKIVR